MDTFISNRNVTTDSVTGTYSQKWLNDYAIDLIRQKQAFSYLLLDLDNFTYIKDAFGNLVANKVLQCVTVEIQKIIKDRGFLARDDEDEFSLIYLESSDYDKLWNLCHTIMVRINEMALEDIGEQTLTVTIGLCRFPENADNFDELSLNTQKAIYRGKTKGRNCFIIYQPEKHANIIPKDDKEKALGSMSLHSNVFRFLTSRDDLRMGILNLFNFVSSYFEVDHICIQTEKRIILQKIHPLSKNKEFKYISHDLIRTNMNRLSEVLYVNDTKNLIRSKHEDLYEVFSEQNITSTCFCEISYRNTQYGMLRADMTGSANGKRLWKYSEMDLLLTAAKTIALVLHYTGKTLDNL